MTQSTYCTTYPGIITHAQIVVLCLPVSWYIYDILYVQRSWRRATPTGGCNRRNWLNWFIRSFSFLVRVSIILRKITILILYTAVHCMCSSLKGLIEGRPVLFPVSSLPAESGIDPLFCWSQHSALLIMIWYHIMYQVSYIVVPFLKKVRGTAGTSIQHEQKQPKNPRGYSTCCWYDAYAWCMIQHSHRTSSSLVFLQLCE